MIISHFVHRAKNKMFTVRSVIYINRMHLFYSILSVTRREGRIMRRLTVSRGCTFSTEADFNCTLKAWQMTWEYFPKYLSSRKEPALEVSVLAAATSAGCRDSSVADMESNGRPPEKIVFKHYKIIFVS